MAGNSAVGAEFKPIESCDVIWFFRFNKELRNLLRLLPQVKAKTFHSPSALASLHPLEQATEFVLLKGRYADRALALCHGLCSVRGARELNETSNVSLSWRLYINARSRQLL